MGNDHNTVKLPWDGQPESAFASWRKLYETNEKYRALWDEGRGPGQAQPPGTKKRAKPGGPGTELTKMFRPIRVFVRKGCNCKGRAAEMDRRGCDWCEKHLDVIVGWLRQEAEASKLPFNRSLAEMLVKRAIRRARRRALEIR